MSYFNVDIKAYNDYYPFGMLLPNRHANTPDYRYGFQGQEMDDEIKGEGNSLNYTYRMHDPRVGRFFAIDPLASQYPFYSPYQFAGNKVIAHSELEGLEEMVAIIPIDRNQPYIMSVTGDWLEMFVISNGIEYLGGAAENRGFKIAFSKLKKGDLMTNTGKIYNTSVLTKKDIYLIDGTQIKNVTIGKLFGNRLNGTLNTSKGLNQIEVFRPNYLKNATNIAKGLTIALDFVGWIDPDTNEINPNSMMESAISEYLGVVGNSGSAAAVGLLLATSNAELIKMKEESNELLFESVFDGNTPLKDARNILRTVADAAVMPLASNTIEKYLNGSITDLQDLNLYDSEYGDHSSGTGGLIYSTSEDSSKAYIHGVYIPEKKE